MPLRYTSVVLHRERGDQVVVVPRSSDSKQAMKPARLYYGCGLPEKEREDCRSLKGRAFMLYSLEEGSTLHRKLDRFQSSLENRVLKMHPATGVDSSQNHILFRRNMLCSRFSRKELKRGLTTTTKKMMSPLFYRVFPSWENSKIGQDSRPQQQKKAFLGMHENFAF